LSASDGFTSVFLLLNRLKASRPSNPIVASSGTLARYSLPDITTEVDVSVKPLSFREFTSYAAPLFAAPKTALLIV
jgi:hypothetical protein